MNQNAQVYTPPRYREAHRLLLELQDTAEKDGESASSTTAEGEKEPKEEPDTIGKSEIQVDSSDSQQKANADSELDAAETTEKASEESAETGSENVREDDEAAAEEVSP